MLASHRKVRAAERQTARAQLYVRPTAPKPWRIVGGHKRGQKGSRTGVKGGDLREQKVGQLSEKILTRRFKTTTWHRVT